MTTELSMASLPTERQDAPLWMRALAAAPDRMLAALFWTCLVVTGAILLDAFRPVLVIPLIAAVIAATWRVVPSPVPSNRTAAWAAATALLIAAAWLVANLPFASPYLIVDRDPGFLTLAGVWLSENQGPEIPLSPALLDVLASHQGLTAETPGYYHVGEVLYTQGAKLLPGLLAMFGWAGGLRGVLAGNLVIGAFALLSVYALGRRVMGHWWALLPMAGLAVSVPFLAFTRSGYSEPITLALVFAGLVYVWDGLHRRRIWPLGVGGGIIGSAALARIDGAGPAIGLVAGMALAAALATAPRVRRFQIAGASVAIIAAVAMVFLGFVDLAVHSPVYLDDLASQFAMLIAALIGTVVFGLVINLPYIWRPIRRLALHRRKALAIAVAVGLALVAIALVTRPWWYEGHGQAPGTNPSILTAGLQEREGVAVEPTRSYDEYTVTWLSWYLGWPLVAAGFGGFALLGYRAARRRDACWLALLGVFGAPTLLYLWQISITPDQIWAMRRLLPITIPALLVAAALALAALWSVRKPLIRGITVVIALLAFAFPLTTWGDIVGSVEHGGRYGQVTSLCDVVDGRPVVLYGVPAFAPTLHTVCGVEVLTASTPLDAEQLASVQRMWGTDVAAVTQDPSAFPWQGSGDPTPTIDALITRWELTLTRRPSAVTEHQERLYVGSVTEDGLVIPEGPVSIP